MFLFPPCDTILENNSDALGIKSLILRVYLAIQRSSENIDPIKIDKYGIQTIKNGNVSLLSLYKKNLYSKILSSILMSRSKNEAWFSR